MSLFAPIKAYFSLEKSDLSFIPKSNDLILLGLLAGLAGAILALLAYPSLDQAVETAQVQAGLINYEPENPFYQYHIKVFSLPIFIAKMLLPALGESAVTMVLNALGGILSMVAVTFLAYAFSKHKGYALLVAFTLNLSTLYDAKVPYHLTLFGTGDSHGRTGLLILVLTLALLILRFDRCGVLLLSLSPLFHATLGLYFFGLVWGCVLVALTYGKRKKIAHFPPFEGIWKAYRWALLGLAIDAVMVGNHLFEFGPLQEVPTEEDYLLLAQFYNTMANHHIDFPFNLENLLVLFCFILFWFATAQKGLDRFEIFTATLFLGGMVFLIGSYLPWSVMPLAFWQMVPPRMMNSIFLITPIILLARPARSKEGWPIAIGSCLGLLLLTTVKQIGIFYQIYPFGLVTLLALARYSPAGGANLNTAPPRWVNFGLAVAFLATISLYAAQIQQRIENSCPDSFNWSCWNRTYYSNYQDDPFFKKVHQDTTKLVVIGSGMGLMQLRGGVPLYLPHAINQGQYVPATMSTINERLKPVYNLDIRNYHGKPSGGIPHEANHELMEYRRPFEWQRLGVEQGFDALISSFPLRPMSLTAQKGDLYFYKLEYDPEVPVILGNDNPGKYDKSFAFDASAEPDSFWEASPYPQEVIFKYAHPLALEAIKLDIGEFANRTPTEYQLLGSQDGKNYKLLKSWSVTAFKPNQIRLFPTPEVPYLYYKIKFLGGKEPILRIYEITPLVKKKGGP